MTLPLHHCRKCGMLMVCDQDEFMGRAYRCPACEHTEDIIFNDRVPEQRDDDTKGDANGRHL